MKNISFFKFWRPVFLGLVILLLCLIPSSSIEKIDFLKIDFQDLIAHLLMFLIFSILLAIDLRRYKSFNGNKSLQIICILIVVVVFASITEILQYATPTLNRSANFVDFFSDVAGAVTGIIIITLIK